MGCRWEVPKLRKVPILEKVPKMKNLQNVKFFQVGKSGRVWDGDKKNFLSFYH
jgi:hypothetical protein